MADMKVFTGNAHPALAASVAASLGLEVGRATVEKFSDGETFVDILENVRGRDVFVIQPTCAPTNDNLMELVLLADALRRASAGSVTTVIPYFGYARQDRRVRSARVPISAKVVADMVAGVGVRRVITVDLHADQIQGFFKIPVDNIYATSVMLHDIESKGYENVTVVSPDVGGVVRARALAKRLNDTDLAIIDKRRPAKNQSQVMHIIGDVKGQHCIIADDMVDTAGTLCQAAKALKEAGAVKVTAYCTHAVLSGRALDNISASPLDELVVTDSIPLSEAAESEGKIRQLALAPILAETIRRVTHQQSLRSMYNEE